MFQTFFKKKKDNDNVFSNFTLNSAIGVEFIILFIDINGPAKIDEHFSK